MPYTHLTLCDRKVIKKMIDQEKNYSEIARLLGFHRSTISREVNRNKTRYWYRPIDAHYRYLQRRQRKRTIEKNIELKNYIENKLKQGWSPDAIAGRLKQEYSKKSMHISHESIYLWIYNLAEQGNNIYRLLPRSIRKRKRRSAKRQHRISIPDRKSIHIRPKTIESRRIKGHWEGDTIVGKNRDGYIATIVERKSYFLAAAHMENKQPDTCNRSFLEAFGDIDNSSIKTITLDNGTEFFKYKDLEDALECNIYFADPYSSWQRGINEHTNGMLRRFFPKSMSFKKLSQNAVDLVVELLNNIPRKSLNYRTPYEVFYGLPVALQC